MAKTTPAEKDANTNPAPIVAPDQIVARLQERIDGLDASVHQLLAAVKTLALNLTRNTDDACAEAARIINGHCAPVPGQPGLYAINTLHPTPETPGISLDAASKAAHDKWRSQADRSYSPFNTNWEGLSQEQRYQSSRQTLTVLEAAGVAVSDDVPPPATT